jgi:hypothetical protein
LEANEVRYNKPFYTHLCAIENGGIALPQIEKEMHSYRTHHVSYWLQTTEGKKIMKEYTKLVKDKMPQYHSLSTMLEISLKNLVLNWVVWNNFRDNLDDFIENIDHVATISK